MMQRYSQLGGSITGLDENSFVSAQKRYLQQQLLLQQGMLNAYPGQLSSQALKNISLLLRQQQLLAVQQRRYWPQQQGHMAVPDSDRSSKDMLSRDHFMINQTHGARGSDFKTLSSDQHQSRAKLSEVQDS